MGLARYYQRFFKYFSKIANPITNLQKKNKVFKWIEKYKKNFITLKQRLTTTLVLTIPNWHGDFTVCTKASLEGLGGVLSQNGNLVA